MSTSTWVTVGLLIVSAILQACAGLVPSGAPDLQLLTGKIVEAVTTKPAEYLQTPEGQAVMQSLIQKYAGGMSSEAQILLGSGAATGLSGLFLALRGLLTRETAEKSSRKRGDLHARIDKIENGKA